jgi:hypothetical protein
MSSTQSRQSSSEEAPTPPNVLGWSSCHSRDTILDFDNMPLDIQSLTAQTETKVHDAILKEINEWFELNEKDTHLSYSQYFHNLGRRDGRNTLLPKHIADLTLEDVAIQLLASCFTEIQYHLGSTTLPTALYMSKTLPSIISSLKMHSHYRLSPASGYHPRDPSPAPAWPGLTTGPSPEERLAERVSRHRKLEMLKNSPDRVESMQDFVDWSNTRLAEDMCQPRRLPDQVAFIPNPPTAPMLPPQVTQDVEAEEAEDELEEDDLVVKHFGARLKRSRSFWFGHLRPARSSGTDESDDQPIRESLAERRSAADLKRRRLMSVVLPTSATYTGNPSTIRGRGKAKWDLKPVLRSEPHPLFIQPVKDYTIRRSKSKPEGRMRAAARTTFTPMASAPDAKGTTRSNISSPSRASSTPGQLSAISSSSRLRPAPFENGRRVPTVTPVSRTPPDDPSELITALEYLSETRRSSDGEVATKLLEGKGKEQRRSSTA